jgi:hypothetical protein
MNDIIVSDVSFSLITKLGSINYSLRSNSIWNSRCVIIIHLFGSTMI